MVDFLDLKKSDISEIFSDTESKIVYVFACGYESRSLSLLKQFYEYLMADNVEILCFGFSTFRNYGARPSNDSYLRSAEIDCIDVDQGEYDEIYKYISSRTSSGTKLIIDYSSMPRSWYCSLGRDAVNGKLGSEVCFLYSQSKYSPTEYPCVGYGEFNVFSGRPTILSDSEVDIFGLGFDSTRTHGIWNYLDPDICVSVIAKSESNSEHKDRVFSENPEIIGSSARISEVRMDDFSEMLSSLIDLCNVFSYYGNVSLVPDGPKPLVLAMSILPVIMDFPGIYCWHVGHVKPNGYAPVDVESSGDIFGFIVRE